MLVAASRADHPHHAVARAWLETALAAAEAGTAFTLMPMVLASFLRLVSSARIFKLPTPVDEAIRFVDAMLASPGTKLAERGPEWPRLRQLFGQASHRQRSAGCLVGGSNHAAGRTTRQL